MVRMCGIKRTILVVLLLLAVGLVEASERAAHAIFVVGETVVIGRDGVQRPLTKGGALHAGEKLQTAANAMAQLRFTDGGVVVLYGDSRFMVEQYRFEAEAGSQRAWFHFPKGVLRTISGSIGKRQRAHYRMRTPMAMIGIRGTEYLAEVAQGLTVSVLRGAVEVRNDAGRLEIKTGFSGFTPDFHTAPGFTKRRLRTLPKIQAGKRPKPPTQATTHQASPSKRDAAHPSGKKAPKWAEAKQVARQKMRDALMRQGVDVALLEKGLAAQGHTLGQQPGQPSPKPPPSPKTMETLIRQQGLDPEKVRAGLIDEMKRAGPEAALGLLPHLGVGSEHLGQMLAGQGPPLPPLVMDLLKAKGIDPKSIQMQPPPPPLPGQPPAQWPSLPSREVMERLNKAGISSEALFQRAMKSPLPPLPPLVMDQLKQQGIRPDSFKTPQALHDHLKQTGSQEVQELLKQLPPPPPPPPPPELERPEQPPPPIPDTNFP
ncbi:MAG: FecR domain-containing protein [Magnetococcales bacterium]|nr:FecR domain-containing protein [Magnetococcales bacterium]